MILLDTNVISEPMRQKPNTQVAAWIDEQAVETLYISAITVAELRFGVATLPVGKRKDILQDSLERRILPLFFSRILAFDFEASGEYAKLMAKTRSEGLALGLADSYIAAIAAAHGMLVATRDTSPFIAAGIPIINPWESKP
jgi:predicted nucleic acid-binding protein